jgi:hypothetical protein
MNFKYALCTAGLAAGGFASADVILDNIGDVDGSGIGGNISASQYFNADFAAYDIATAQSFSTDGAMLEAVEAVVNGWNGYTGPDGISGYKIEFHSSQDALCAQLMGDVDSVDGTPEVSGDWGGAGSLIRFAVTTNLTAGDYYVSVLPINDFGVNGQTGIADTLADSVVALQSNPNGGFGFGCQDLTAGAAYRLTGAAGDPCAMPLGACPADVNDDGSVNVGDLLTILDNWGAVGDGTSRPVGDCRPLPLGDCAVNVSDLLGVIDEWGNSDCVATGACCYADGSCADGTSEAACSDAGGSYLGDDSDCTACVAGACCYGDQTCEMLTADGCSDAGGAYQGDVACADITCPTEYGACCYDEVTCLDGFLEGDCVGSGGSFQGEGSECDSLPDGCYIAGPPANDDCSGATEVVDGDNDVTNDLATNSGIADFTLCDNFDIEDNFGDVWYTYTASCTGMVTASTCDTFSADSRLQAYSGPCDALEQIACNDDGEGCTGYTSILEFPATEGETYTIRLGCFSDGEYGSGTMNISCADGSATGACCIDQDCFDDYAQVDCATAGGTFFGGATCTAELCATPACPTGEIEDCCGNCCPETWVGDGYCDNGAYLWNGIAIWLNCDEFDCDGGDCGDDCTPECGDDPPGGDCPDGEIADCCGNCAPETWVGDGYCDNGAYQWNGVAIWLNCDEFDCDAGDCGDDCTANCG